MLTALHSEPDIGLVGPCSNFVGSEQRIEVEYGTLTGLDGFAWEWGKTHDRSTGGHSPAHRILLADPAGGRRRDRASRRALRHWLFRGRRLLPAGDRAGCAP